MSIFFRRPKINRDSGEVVLVVVPASHVVGIENVGGKLYLTNRRLIFKSHLLNIQIHELSIPLEGITAEQYSYLHWRVYTNGLMIKKADNSIEKFIVHDPEAWVNILNSEDKSDLRVFRQ